jgi:hypothetical protein
VQLVQRMLSWPPAQLFPALDLARCLALEPGAAAALAESAGSAAQPGAGGVSLAVLQAAGDRGNAAAQQTALRLAANCVKQPPLRAWLAANRGGLLDAFAGAGGSGKGVRSSLATLLLNLAIDLRAGGASSADLAEPKMQVGASCQAAPAAERGRGGRCQNGSRPQCRAVRL